MKLDFKKRPLSWSQLSSFEYDPEQWYRRYILNEEQPPSKEMLFGKIFATSCENGTPLAPVTMLSKMEQKFEVNLSGISLVGFADTYCDKTKKKIGEHKTSKTLWTQKKVDSHGQLTMYALMNYITHKIDPKDITIFLECIQTEETGDFQIQLKKPVKVHHFKTKRTMRDILDFTVYIKNTIRRMEEYIKNK